MAFEKVNSNRKFYNLKECEKGQVLAEGYYLKDIVSQKYGNTQHEIKDSERGIVVLGGGALNQAMGLLEKGAYVRVTYDGTIKLESGNFKGNDCHQFIVEEDKDRAMTSVQAAQESATADAQAESTQTPAETAEATEAVQQAAEAAAETAEAPKSSTSDLLKKYKKNA